MECVKYFLAFAVVMGTYPAFTAESATEQHPLVDTLSDDERLALLVASAEKTLEGLKNIQRRLRVFREQEKKCVAQGSGREAKKDDLFEFSRQAYELLELIKDRQLQPYFRKKFLDELEMISRLYKSKNVPSPRIEER